MPLNPIEYLRVKSEQSESRSTAVSTRQAVEAFARYVGGADISFDSFDSTLLGEWVAHLLYYGYTLKTAAYYVKRLAAIYSKAVADGLATATDAFAFVQAKLNAPEASHLAEAADKETFNKLRRIVLADYSASPARRLAKDMLLLAILDGGLTPGEIAAYKKDQYRGDDEHIRNIIDRYSRAKNKYLFPLDHSTKSPRQLAATVELLLRDITDSVGLRMTADATIDMWCMAAMACGIAPSDIAACAGNRCDTNVVTAFVTPSALDAERIGDIRRQVATALTDNPLRWYAMHLRRHVDYDMIAARLRECRIDLADTYYPMEDIVRKVGHRKIFETRPVVSWLLFFRSPASELNSLYNSIGDLAWGYRQTRRVNAPYAVISPEEILCYQRAIGTFAAADIVPTEDVDLRPGDRLIIIGGLLEGHLATFDSVVERPACETRPCRDAHEVDTTHEADTAHGFGGTQNSNDLRRCGELRHSGDLRRCGDSRRCDDTQDSNGSQQCGVRHSGDLQQCGDSRQSSVTKTVYRIILDGGLHCDWVVDQDPRLVKKITDPQSQPA